MEVSPSPPPSCPNSPNWTRCRWSRRYLFALFLVPFICRNYIRVDKIYGFYMLCCDHHVQDFSGYHVREVSVLAHPSCQEQGLGLSGSVPGSESMEVVSQPVYTAICATLLVCGVMSPVDWQVSKEIGTHGQSCHPMLRWRTQVQHWDFRLSENDVWECETWSKKFVQFFQQLV